MRPRWIRTRFTFLRMRTRTKGRTGAMYDWVGCKGVDGTGRVRCHRPFEHLFLTIFTLFVIVHDSLFL